MSDDRTDALSRLEAAHRFPGPFSFKAIGQGGDAFVEGVREAALAIVGPRAECTARLRHSQKSRHLAVTLTVHCERAEQVLEIYGALRAVAGLQLLL